MSVSLNLKSVLGREITILEADENFLNLSTQVSALDEEYIPTKAGWYYGAESATIYYPIPLYISGLDADSIFRLFGTLTAIEVFPDDNVVVYTPFSPWAPESAEIEFYGVVNGKKPFYYFNDTLVDGTRNITVASSGFLYDTISGFTESSDGVYSVSSFIIDGYVEFTTPVFVAGVNYSSVYYSAFKDVYSEYIDPASTTVDEIHFQNITSLSHDEFIVSDGSLDYVELDPSMYSIVAVGDATLQQPFGDGSCTNFYEFETNTGNVMVDSIAANNFTLNVFDLVDGKYGNGCYNDDSSEELSDNAAELARATAFTFSFNITSSSLFYERTFGFGVSPSTAKQAFAMYVKNSASQGTPDLSTSTGEMYIKYDGSTESAKVSSNEVTSNKWFNVIFSYTGGVLEMYLNNVFVGSYSIVLDIGKFTPNYVMGASYSTFSYDSFRFFNKALNSTERELLKDEQFFKMALNDSLPFIPTEMMSGTMPKVVVNGLDQPISNITYPSGVGQPLSISSKARYFVIDRDITLRIQHSGNGDTTETIDIGSISHNVEVV